MRIFDELELGAELVLGSRNLPGGSVQGWGFGRRFISRGGSLYSRLVLLVETPITFVDRRVGRSKMDRQIFLEAVAVVWRLRLDALRGRL